MPTSALLERIHQPDNKRYLIELNNRFAFPAACLVLMLVGVPLGVTSRRGGKSSGFVFTMLLVFHLLLSVVHRRRARRGRTSCRPLSPCGPPTCCSPRRDFPAVADGNRRARADGTREPDNAHSETPRFGYCSGSSRQQLAPDALLERRHPRSVRKAYRGAFPRILDEYVVREFLATFLMVLSGFVLLMLVFTFFELVGDIIRNHIPLTTVGLYLINLTPSMLYTIAPLAVLIAVLVTFGVLNRNSEIIAMKATGISLYRLVIPILVISATLAVSLFRLRRVLSAAGQPQAGAVAQHHQGQAAANLSASRAEMDLRPAARRRAGTDFLLPILRSRPEGVCQSVGVRVRSVDVCAVAPDLCRPRLLG